eukprot:NODE_8070_length_299_cov_81.524000_g7331_i0.p4 GENE.NODE_8070_length_299_cov_81.524000_g7331_i0~~NODE_8070_length_299_cov_81.524000_g7331_i0.p4  ORF type:complete len:58 (+),score=15.58 NODE_8070_length_299_cov_81.524000_g7331_i0:123-296(+)
MRSCCGHATAQPLSRSVACTAVCILMSPLTRDAHYFLKEVVFTLAVKKKKKKKKTLR